MSRGFWGYMMGDYTSLVTVQYPWFLRGGLYSNYAPAGIFSFYNYIGSSYFYESFRLILMES